MTLEKPERIQHLEDLGLQLEEERDRNFCKKLPHHGGWVCIRFLEQEKRQVIHNRFWFSIELEHVKAWSRDKNAM